MYFESNILYAKEFKRDYIKIDEDKEIHYVISTNQQQSRWHIAINLVNVDTGKCVQRNDLSKVFDDYQKIFIYLQKVRQDILQPKDINTEMIDDITKILCDANKLAAQVTEFRNRYFS